MQLFHHVASVPVGQLVVHQNKIEWRSARQLDRLTTGRSASNFIPLLIKNPREHVPRILVIFDKQQIRTHSMNGWTTNTGTNLDTRKLLFEVHLIVTGEPAPTLLSVPETLRACERPRPLSPSC